MEGYRIIHSEWIRGWVESSKVDIKKHNLMQIQVINKTWISQGGGGLEKVNMVFLDTFFLRSFFSIHI